jgi:hypothetical protein
VRLVAEHALEQHVHKLLTEKSATISAAIDGPGLSTPMTVNKQIASVEVESEEEFLKRTKKETTCLSANIPRSEPWHEGSHPEHSGRTGFIPSGGSTYGRAGAHATSGADSWGTPIPSSSTTQAEPSPMAAASTASRMSASDVESVSTPEEYIPYFRHYDMPVPKPFMQETRS